MRLENTFEVPAPPDEAWRLLTDVPRVVPCMPGAELTEVVDDSTWKAKMHVKLGPISLQFGTDVTREIMDDAARTTTLQAKARELKGRGGATATIESSLEPAGSGTRVTIVTDLTLQGAVAQYGRGVIADVSNQLVARFADCLADQLREPAAPAAAAPAAPEPATAREVAPIGGLGLVLRALARPVLRLVGRR